MINWTKKKYNTLPFQSQVHNKPLLCDVIRFLLVGSRVNVITESVASSSSSSSSPVFTDSERLGIVSTKVVVSTSNTDTRGPH